MHPENPRELGLNPPGVWLTPHAGVLVGHSPSPSQVEGARLLDELQRNLQEVVCLLLEDGDPTLDAEFVGIQTVAVA